MGNFTREECEYTNFIIEKTSITFSCDNNKNVLISIPITDDTPQCIKEKLNEVLWENMNKFLDSLDYFGCMNNPCNCLLSARMQVIYDGELGVQYYLAFKVQETVEDFETYFDNCVLISTEEYELHNEFVSYCRYKLDKILFPSW